MLVQRNLGEGLGLHNDGETFCIFRDHLSGLEYIRNSRELCQNGLYIELDAYQCHVFLDWREVQDNEWRQYAHLAAYLNGRGVPSIEEALREVLLQPIHGAFRELVNAGHLRWLFDNRVTEPGGQTDPELVAEAERRVLRLLREAKQFSGGTGDEAGIAQEIRRKLEAILRFSIFDFRFTIDKSKIGNRESEIVVWGTLLSWLFIHALGKVAGDEGFAGRSRGWMDEWLLSKLVAGALQDLGLDEGAAWWSVATVKILINHQGWHEIEPAEKGRAYQVLVSWLRDSEVQQFLQVNRHRDVLWFNHEAFQQLLAWMLTLAIVEINARPELAPDEIAQQVEACYDVVKTLQQAEEASDYQVAKLMEAARS
jgi:hypothetical protein